MLAKGRGQLDVITSARLAWYPHQLASDYARLSLAYSFAGIIDHIAQDRHSQPELYAHLSDGLRAIEDNGGDGLTELWFKLRVLNLIGLRPALQNCFACGRQDGQSIYHLDPAHGIVCASCAPATARSISVDGIKLWRWLCDHPTKTAIQIVGATELAEATLPDCESFMEHHLGKSFRRI